MRDTNHVFPADLGEYCEGCGTVHRVVESLPDRPLTRGDIETIEETDGIEYAAGVLFDLGVTTESIVLSTRSKSRLLDRFEGIGWIVGYELEHDEDDDPVKAGRELHLLIAQFYTAILPESVPVVFDDE